MAVLRLTSANLAFIKPSLRRAHPSIKSSHLTEALAAAVGSQTHAALLTRLDAQDIVVRIDTMRWHERLTDFGYAGHGDDLTEIIRDPNLPDPCWREIKRRDRSGSDAWFRACQAADIPYICISPGQKYARLEWDCISTSGRGEKGVRGEDARPLGRSLFMAFQQRAKHDAGRPMFQGSSFTGVIERLSPDTARALADDYFLALSCAIAEAANPQAA